MLHCKQNYVLLQAFTDFYGFREKWTQSVVEILHNIAVFFANTVERKHANISWKKDWIILYLYWCSHGTNQISEIENILWYFWYYNLYDP